jgi:endonuclease/exonuclease/phosphatase family metal-dependent hydrolase
MKLVTWNTQWCCGLDGLVSPGRIVQDARRLADFDVLCLWMTQRFRERWDGKLD